MILVFISPLFFLCFSISSPFSSFPLGFLSMFLSFMVSLNSISFPCSSLSFFLSFLYLLFSIFFSFFLNFFCFVPLFFFFFSNFYCSSDCVGRCGSHGPLFQPPPLHPPSLILIPIFTSSNNSREINWEKRRAEKRRKERESSDIFPGLGKIHI